MIENCIKHNVVSLEHPMHIMLYVEDDNIVVENQLQPKRNEESSLGVGLKNISMRYSHLIDKQTEIITTDKTFKIKLPLIYEYHHN